MRFWSLRISRKPQSLGGVAMRRRDSLARIATAVLGPDGEDGMQESQKQDVGASPFANKSTPVVSRTTAGLEPALVQPALEFPRSSCRTCSTSSPGQRVSPSGDLARHRCSSSVPARAAWWLVFARRWRTQPCANVRQSWVVNSRAGMARTAWPRFWPARLATSAISRTVRATCRFANTCRRRLPWPCSHIPPASAGVARCRR